MRKAGIVDEDAAVDLAHIDAFHSAGRHRPDRSCQVERNPLILGKVVERTQREHAEDGIGVHQHRCRRAQRAVTATDDDQAGTAFDGVFDDLPDGIGLDASHTRSLSALAEFGFDLCNRALPCPHPEALLRMTTISSIAVGGVIACSARRLSA